MSNDLSQKTVMDVLRVVEHPEMPNTTLVELGMIQSATVKERRVEVNLALPNLNVPIKEQLIILIEQAIEKSGEFLEVEVVPVEMNEDQKSKFTSISRIAMSRPRVSRAINYIIAVMSGKGGVGKSSVAALLAAALQRRGLQVGILDADITGPSIPKVFGAQHHPTQVAEGILPVESNTGIRIMSINLLLPDTDQPVVWRGPLISKAIEQFWRDILWGDLDYLIVDLPPGTADAALTVMQSLPLDGVVLVTSPQDLAGMVVRKAANMAVHIGVPLIGLVENMSHIICPECGAKIHVFGSSRTDETLRSIGIPMLGRLPLDTKIATLCDKGEVENYYGDEFESITDKVIQALQSTSVMTRSS